MAIDSALVAKLIQQHLEHKNKPNPLAKLGMLPSLPDFIRRELPQQMRKERGNKRVRKKRAKKSLRFTWGMVMAMQAMRPRRINYAEIGRAMFPIQSLPDGALVVYDKDPDITSIITESP